MAGKNAISVRGQETVRFRLNRKTGNPAVRAHPIVGPHQQRQRLCFHSAPPPLVSNRTISPISFHLGCSSSVEDRKPSVELVYFQLRSLVHRFERGHRRARVLWGILVFRWPCQDRNMPNTQGWPSRTRLRAGMALAILLGPLPLPAQKYADHQQSIGNRRGRARRQTGTCEPCIRETLRLFKR